MELTLRLILIPGKHRRGSSSFVICFIAYRWPSLFKLRQREVSERGIHAHTFLLNYMRGSSHLISEILDEVIPRHPHFFFANHTRSAPSNLHSKCLFFFYLSFCPTYRLPLFSLVFLLQHFFYIFILWFSLTALLFFLTHFWHLILMIYNIFTSYSLLRVDTISSLKSIEIMQSFTHHHFLWLAVRDIWVASHCASKVRRPLTSFTQLRNRYHTYWWFDSAW